MFEYNVWLSAGNFILTFELVLWDLEKYFLLLQLYQEMVQKVLSTVQFVDDAVGAVINENTSRNQTKACHRDQQSFLNAGKNQHFVSW